MAVEAVSNGGNPYIQNANSGGDDVAQLQRQKEMLQKQLEAVKSKQKNSQAEQDAAVKQIEQLKEKIAEIDKKIQRSSKNQHQGQNASGTSAAKSKKGALSQSNRPLAGVQKGQSILHNMRQNGMQKKGLDKKSKTADQLLDTYA